MVRMDKIFSGFQFHTHVQGGRQGLPTNVHLRIQREGGLKIAGEVMAESKHRIFLQNFQLLTPFV